MAHKRDGLRDLRKRQPQVSKGNSIGMPTHHLLFDGTASAMPTACATHFPPTSYRNGVMPTHATRIDASEPVEGTRAPVAYDHTQALTALYELSQSMLEQERRRRAQVVEQMRTAASIINVLVTGVGAGEDDDDDDAQPEREAPGIRTTLGTSGEPVATCIYCAATYSPLFVAHTATCIIKVAEGFVAGMSMAPQVY